MTNTSRELKMKRLVISIILGAAAVFLILDLFLIEMEHPVFLWHRLPGAYLIIGFVSAAALAAFAITAGTWLQRSRSPFQEGSLEEREPS